MVTMLEKPNLPQGRVKAVVCDQRISPTVENNLHALGIIVIKTPPCQFLPAPTASHPDMLLCHAGGRLWLRSDIADPIIRQLREYRLDSLIPYEIINKHIACPLKYPENIAFNCAVLGDRVICNAPHTAPDILSCFPEDRILHTKQGYAKCSVCIVGERAVITEDASIAAICAARGLDVLKLSPGGVRLRGYDYGFIGGASGLIGKDQLAFFGNVERHKEKRAILSFLEKHHLSYVCLDEGDLYDYGSLLPIIEEK